LATHLLPLDLLDREWATFARSRRAEDWFDAWHSQVAPAVPCRSLPDLVAYFENRERSRIHDDTVFRGLVAYASTGEAMAARVLLQLLMPGWRSLARRFEWLVQAEELQALVVAIAYERISGYPISRRPGSVAANILGDTRQWLLRRLRHVGREVPAPHPADLRPRWSPQEAVPAAGEELLDLLCTAVEDGLLDSTSATLIARTRFGVCTVSELAHREGVDADTVRRRRHRAELRLREAAA